MRDQCRNDTYFKAELSTDFNDQTDTIYQWAIYFKCLMGQKEHGAANILHMHP